MRERLEEGVWLFNRREFFECHQVWEALWRELEGEEKRFVGSLVQLAVAMHLRFDRGSGRGARNLLRQALAILEDFRPSREGIDVDRLWSEIDTFAERIDRKGEGTGFVDRWLAPKIRFVG